MQANSKQIAGDHYKKYGDLQPWDVILSWNLGYLEGTALKYIARWRDKGGLDDIRKAVHFLEKLLEVESGKEQPDSQNKTPSDPALVEKSPRKPPVDWPFPLEELQNGQIKPNKKVKKNR